MEHHADQPEPTTLVRDLGHEDDSVRKMAAFRLQSAIGDPSFSDAFIQEGGLPRLRSLALTAHGNTLSYSLTSFSRLLELDQGWDYVDKKLIERLVQIVASQPLVNILRGAMSILVAIVSHPQQTSADSEVSGFKALKPAIAVHPQFLEMLVSRLSSADHGLCANALQLLNSLMRDAITNDSDIEWAKFINQLHELGVIKAVYILMGSSSLYDLGHPLLEFQTLTKMLLRKWKEVPINLENREHRISLKSLHQASKANTRYKENGANKRIPYEWRRIGFETESPMYEFDTVGYLGMMDLTDYVRKSEDGFQKLLLEQSAKPHEQRCPIARASIALTSILYDHFEIDNSDDEDRQRYVTLESRSNLDKAFKPLLLQWSRLHSAGLQAFLRLWTATGAEKENFNEIEELVRILVEQVLESAPRTKDITATEEELRDFELAKLRELQMDLLELTHEDAWGHHLRQVKDELHHEALHFIKEQRIRCLLEGAWFPSPPNTSELHQNRHSMTAATWRFVRLSHNRRFLHFDDFGSKPPNDIPVALDSLDHKIDLSIVSSVVSDVISQSPTSSATTLKNQRRNSASPSTEITIHGYLPVADAAISTAHSDPNAIRSPTNNGHEDGVETPLLSFHPQTHTLASEWLDGLLLLLNQAPITSETNKMVAFIARYGLRIRLLNVRYEEGLGGAGVNTGATGDVESEHKGVYGVKEVELPDRDGVDEEFYYEIRGM